MDVPRARRVRLWWPIVLGTAVLALGGYLIVFAIIPDTRFTYGVASISRNEAVLLTRRNEDDATFFWIQLVRSDGSVTWSKNVSPLEVNDALGFTGVAASDDRLVLLGERNGTTVVAALERASGEPAWETVLFAQSGPNRIGTTLIVDAPRVYAVETRYGPPDRQTITALSLADGVVQWTYEIGDDATMQVALISPGTVLVDGVELDGATGKVRGAPPFERYGCDTPRGVVGFTRDNKVVLVPPPLADGKQAEQVVALVDGVRAERRSVCGTRGEDVIVGVSADGVRGASLARLDPRSGAMRWKLPLSSGKSFEEGVSVDGSLPRFLPVTVFGSEIEAEPIVSRVVVVDLDQGVVVADHAPTGHAIAFVTAERAYVMESSRSILFALDPATGALASATRLDNVYSVDVRREDLRFGRLWIPGSAFARPSSLGWIVFDLESAKPIHVNGRVVPVDVTADGWAMR